MKKIILKSIKIFCLVIVIFLASSKSMTFESKVNNTNLNKTVNLSTMALKVNDFKYEENYTPLDTFTGDLTAYVYNCPACGGHLGCLYNYNIKDGTNTYPDETYGKVSIVASSRNLPCGSIIRFKHDRISTEETYAIVLDRGVLGNSIDYLAKDMQSAKRIGRSTITYDVLRSGW